MPKRAAGPPFPDSPGAWIACFRHRVQVGGGPISPEELGRHIGRSGATVRRWESNSLIPDEGDVARLAFVCDLTPLQVAFLSAACTRILATPAPDMVEFRRYMNNVLQSTPYPAMLHDSLFYVRAWNSYVDALGPGTARTLQQDVHPMALLMRAREYQRLDPEAHQEVLRKGLRIFWMRTAYICARPEYKALIADLRPEPGFEELWWELAFSHEHPPLEPIDFANSLGSGGAQFRVYGRMITFPPLYYLHEYHPADELAESRLERLRALGRPDVCYKNRLQWVDRAE